jgi:hypothetical protein
MNYDHFEFSDPALHGHCGAIAGPEEVQIHHRLPDRQVSYIYAFEKIRQNGPP